MKLQPDNMTVPPGREVCGRNSHPYRGAHRISAAVLAFGGIYWAMLLLLAALVPPVGLLYNMMHIPGWIVFFGWCHIAFGRSVDLSMRFFWSASAMVNLAYFIVHLEPWHHGLSLSRDLD